VDSGITFQKPWQSEDTIGILMLITFTNVYLVATQIHHIDS